MSVYNWYLCIFIENSSKTNVHVSLYVPIFPQVQLFKKNDYEANTDHGQQFHSSN